MSIVIVGGNDRMVCQYKEICKNFRCRAKVFTQMPADFRGQIGKPDLMILFTGTVSHKMAGCALKEAARNNTPLARCHSSSACALRSLLEEYCPAG